MLNALLRGILSAYAVKLLDNYRKLSIQLFRIEAARCYLHFVQTARRSALGLTGLMLVVTLIGIGALLFHVGLFILLPGSLKIKAAFGMALGLTYVLLGGWILYAVLSEKTWLDKSGACKMLEKAVAAR